MATIKIRLLSRSNEMFWEFFLYIPLVYRAIDESSLKIKPAIFTLRANTCKRKHSGITHFYVTMDKISILNLNLNFRAML
jgi:hypothetical protein